MTGTVQTTLLERHPVALHGSAFGFVWALSIAIFGGTGPIITTFLAGRGITFVMSAYFMLLVAYSIRLWGVATTPEV